jgi:DNA topoisomerase-1
MSSLVIVESPAKAKTLSRILGKDFKVEASYGHVRDLPQSADEIPARLKKESWARLGVDVDSGFEPLYVIPRDKKKHLAKLKRELAGADELLLATDEDREGESISWHVVELLKPDIPVRRIVFHEITDEAIHEALRRPRGIDDNLVRAQESRRIVDRLFGYQLSPLLWRRVASGLSAGRVQSVAVRLCVMRERERRRFRVAAYWDAEARFGEGFETRLVRLADRRLARGKDFDPETGRLKKGSRALWLSDRAAVEELLAAWRSPWRVSSVEEKPLRRRPAPPFTTSTLQQEANRKLRFSARKTMQIAQRLYEGIDFDGAREGLITYMRTDSLTLSKKALGDAQRVIRQRYGDAFTDGPRQYRTRSKGAQEAHEAIRPTEISRHPEQLAAHLRPDELRLYDMIWKRTVASQMSEARLKRTAVEITAPVAADADPETREGVFAATGKTIEFPGFLRVYVEGSDDPRADLADREVLLPPLAEGQELEPTAVEPVPHETAPPARFTEASLVKQLEAEGIGRPSTYATIIDTIQQRGYVVKQSNALVPTFTAHAVTQLLEKHFREYVDTTFTARMEEDLDEIAEGKLDWQSHLEAFYFGKGTEQDGLEARIANAQPQMEYPNIEIGKHPDSGGPIVVKVGRWGPYLQYTDSAGEKQIASVPEGVAPADLGVAEAVELLAKANRGDRLLGDDSETGLPVYLAHGRYGPYVQLGETPEERKAPKPKRASLPKGVGEEQVTLAAALKWLSLPRSLGTDADGVEVIATTGRFGPYIKRGKDTRSLTAEDDVYTVGLKRALELLAQPKGRRRSGARKVLRELGEDAEGRTVQLLDGRYGPYLTNGDLNASLPKGTAPESLTADAAATLLAERGKPPRRRTRGGKRGKKRR